MKKKSVLFIAVASMAAFMLTSGKNGSGFEKGYNATGSETGLGNINGCKASGCHGTTATPGITLALELDSNGVPQTYYMPGGVYTIKVKGTNTTTTTYPKFGFQVSCIKGSSAVSTPVNAGTMQSTGLPTNVRFTAPTVNFVCSLVEHSNPMPATTLGGGTGGTYVTSFNWIAPVAGTGTVSIWAALLASNDNTLETGDVWNTTKIIINEGIGTLGTHAPQAEISLKAYPNPVTDHVTLQVVNGAAGDYNVNVLDMMGRSVASKIITVNGTSETNISTGNWAPGTYHVVVTKDGSQKVITVVKQ